MLSEQKYAKNTANDDLGIVDGSAVMWLRWSK